MLREVRTTPSLLAVQRARLELPFLDPELRRDLRLIAPHFLDETLRVLAPDDALAATDRAIESMPIEIALIRPPLRLWLGERASRLALAFPHHEEHNQRRREDSHGAKKMVVTLR